MANITVKVDRGWEQALHRFKKECGKENIVGQFKQRQFFRSAAEERRMQRDRAIKRRKKNEEAQRRDTSYKYKKQW